MKRNELKSYLASEDGLACAISREPLTNQNLCIHHMIPPSSGGLDEPDNCLLLSPSINVKINEFSNSIYLKLALPGMREDGSVLDMGRYTLAEYEPRGMRLKDLAEEVSKNVSEKFVLYDYKGAVRSDSSQALDYLNSRYSSDILIDNDYLIIDNEPMKLSKFTKSSYIDLTREKLGIGGRSKSSSNSGISLAPPIEISNKRDIQPSLGVESVSEILSSIIVNQPDDSGMMIGIFGKWGRGKTYLADKTWEHINNNKPDYKRVVFSAWKYQDTKALWAYLYDNLLTGYLEEEKLPECRLGFIKNTKNKAINFINHTVKLWKINQTKYQLAPLVGLALSLIAGYVWFFQTNKLGLINWLIGFFGLWGVIQMVLFYLKFKSSVIGVLNKYLSIKDFSQYLGLQSEIEQEITNLLKTWIHDGSSKKVMLFVDDVDRCNIDQVISIIDGLRLILDNPEINKRLVIITAIDENILKQALIHKYKSVTEEIQQDCMYKEYLEKVFIIGLKLTPLSNVEVEIFLKNILPEAKAESSKQLGNVVSDNSDREVENSKSLPLGEKAESKDVDASSPDDAYDFTLNTQEREYLAIAICRLNHATPRKIRIFYYKYLIMKRLLNLKIIDKDLLEEWGSQQQEKVVIDSLIRVSNGEEISFNDAGLSGELLDSVEQCAKMVCVI